MATNATSSSAQGMHHIHLDNSLGAAFIGLIFAAVLFGVTNVQYLIYYQNAPRDPRLMKLAIAFLWCLDVLHLVLISHTMYFYTVTNFTNVLAITGPTWSICAHVLVTTLGDFIVRLFYAWRVWAISRRNLVLTLGVLVFAVVTLVSGMGFGSKIFFYQSISEFTRISWVIYTSLGSAVAADVWVASSLCFLLARSKTGFKATDSVVNSLILYVINTGLFTSVCATASFVSFAVMPHNYIFIALYFCLPKLYFNALLAMLNARERLRVERCGKDSGSHSFRMSQIISTTVDLPVHSRQMTRSLGMADDNDSPPPALSNMKSDYNFTGKENHSLGDILPPHSEYI